MTLEEMAKNLGVSKTTVSRALSGKGRIGQQTRERILHYAASLEDDSPRTQKKRETGNLGVVFPVDIYTTGNQYFQECLLGICDAATLFDYNVMVITQTMQDFSGVSRLVEEKKVDGIILTRSMVDDRTLKYLTDLKFPVGLTGLSPLDGIIQVDIDNEGAAENLTSLLIGKGYRRFALLVESLSYQVNRSRYDGFCNAVLKNGLSRDNQLIYTGQINMDMIDAIIENIIAKKVECIICGDDLICARIISRMQVDGYRIPRDLAIASLYNGPTLDCFIPSVTAVDVSAQLVGNTIGRKMIQQLEGMKVPSRTMIDYEILMRKSTDRENEL